MGAIRDARAMGEAVQFYTAHERGHDGRRTGRSGIVLRLEVDAEPMVDHWVGRVVSVRATKGEALPRGAADALLDLRVVGDTRGIAMGRAARAAGEFYEHVAGGA